MYYPVKMPWLIKKMYPSLLWEMPAASQALYLTFDDGPHETATPFVLEQLKKYNAKATFFCIGKNVQKYPSIYRRILDEGHVIGNHTQDHLNGWKATDKNYIDNIFEAGKYIDSSLFRPPYGKITRFQVQLLQQARSGGGNPFKIVMWDVLSGDFDTKLSPEKCLQHVLLKSKAGSIIVFHDSTKAWDRMSYALPRTLEHFSGQGFSFRALQNL